MTKTLLNYSITSLDDIEAKGNVQYVQHYLTYFDEYVGAYVWSSSQRELQYGDVRLVGLGTGHGLRDLLLSPWRVFKVARKHKVTHFLTADLVYGWWHSLFLVLFLRAKIVAMPVCTPPEIIKNTGHTYSGHPEWIEKLLINLTFLFSHSILVTKNSFPDRRWVSSLWCRKKMVIAKATPEEMPSTRFLDVIADADDKRGALRKRKKDEPIRIVYTGRLEREKLVGDLIEVAKVLEESGVSFELSLVGDGTLRSQLQETVKKYGIEDKVLFLGFLEAQEVANIMLSNDIFLSTLTGTALKEAALAKLAIVAYAIDFIPDIYGHEKDCLLAEGGNFREMADHVLKLAKNDAYRKDMAIAGHDFATEQWNRDAVRKGLAEVFEGI